MSQPRKPAQRTPDNPPSDNSFAVRLNRLTWAISRRWLTVMLLVVTLYIGLPFAAPVLMRVGATDAGQALYSLYGGLCHQMAFRSWFLFGEQTAYPRASTGITDLKPYELYLPKIDPTIKLPDNLPLEGIPSSEQMLDLRAKFFNGNAEMGYKVGICQRDVAIWLALLAGGIVYSIPAVRRHVRPVPWWLYVLLGLVPIGIDGFSQLLSYPLPPLWEQGLWPVRETTPFFRTLTGALFGLMNAWLAFPYLEESAREVNNEIAAKFRRRATRTQPSK